MDYQRQKIANAEAEIRPIIEQLSYVYIRPQENEENYSSKIASIAEMEVYQTRLRAYLDSWLESNCDFNRWMTEYPDFYCTLDSYVGAFKWRLTPSKDRGAIFSLSLSDDSGFNSYDPEVRAIDNFITILTLPLFNRIGKCKRCKKYYLAESAHERKYCSRQCATGATAIESTRKRLQIEREEKIRKTRKAIKQFKKLKPTVQSWKTWVASRAGVTQKWITHAINRGDLKVPKSLIERK